MGQHRRRGLSAGAAMAGLAQTSKADLLMARTRLEDAAGWAARYPPAQHLLHGDLSGPDGLLGLFTLLDRALHGMDQIILLAQDRGEGE